MNNDDVLWTIDDVAKYFNSTRSSVSQRIVCQDSFPKAIKPENFGKRWDPDEVKKWAKKQRAA